MLPCSHARRSEGWYHLAAISYHLCALSRGAAQALGQTAHWLSKPVTASAADGVVLMLLRVVVVVFL